MEPNPDQLAALREAIGGISTVYGTREHFLFEEMCERGWVKESTLVGDGIAWRLSGDGTQHAFEALEAEALAHFEAWLLTIGDDNDAVDEESGLTGEHVHAVARMAKRGQGLVRVERLTVPSRNTA